MLRALWALFGAVSIASVLSLPAFTHVAPAAPAAPSAPVAGQGEMVYQQGTYTVRFTDAPCTDDEVRQQLENDGVPPAREFEATQGARRYRGCWLKDMGGDIETLDAPDHEFGTIPADWLRRGT